jgi:hypothetical protein
MTSKHSKKEVMDFMKTRLRSNVILCASLFVLAASLTACPGAPVQAAPGGNTISGTVYAASGGDIKNTIVLVCFLSGDTCNSDKSDAVGISTSGKSARFTTPALAQGEYAVFALQGTFENDELKSLETVGVYTKGNNKDAKYTTVKPPASGIEVTLVSLKNPDAGNPAVNPGAATGIPSELQSEFFVGSVSPSNYYNPTTGVFAAPSGTFQSYTFNADGTFVSSMLLQSSAYCSTSIYLYQTGQVQINGDQMTLNFTGGEIKQTNSCAAKENFQRPSNKYSKQYTWRVGPDPESPSITYLYLKDDMGRESRYVKKQ